LRKKINLSEHKLGLLVPELVPRQCGDAIVENVFAKVLMDSTTLPGQKKLAVEVLLVI